MPALLMRGIFLLSWSLSHFTAQAVSVTIYPSADTSLFSNFPDNNLGANSNLVSGASGSSLPSRTLLRFNLLNQIPSNAIIQSVTLTLTVVILPGGGGADSTYDLRRVLVDWSEGRGTGNTGSSTNVGEPTWNHRAYPSTTWASPGGVVSSDYSEIVSAALPIAGFGAYLFASTNRLVEDVQRWVMDPPTNFGWVLMSESENIPFTAKRFASRENSTNQPSLTIDYSVQPSLAIDWIKSNQGSPQFGFTAPAGPPYSVQFKDSVESPNWLELTNISPQTEQANVIITDPSPASNQRYYRIEILNKPTPP